MARFRVFLLLAALVGWGFIHAQNQPAPRASADAYPAWKAEAEYSIGAKLLTKTQIQNSFVTPLAGRYVVVEVGFYPANGKVVSLERSAFALHSSDSKYSVNPADPEEIASILQKRPPSSRDVILYPTANIGYESYPVYDGTGTHRISGPVYGAGVGVGVGSTNPTATTDSDRTTMETELRDKELKAGEVAKPVAGYLYFPLSSKEKATYQLEYRGTDAVSNLPLSEH